MPVIPSTKTHKYIYIYIPQKSDKPYIHNSIESAHIEPYSIFPHSRACRSLRYSVGSRDQFAMTMDMRTTLQIFRGRQQSQYKIYQRIAFLHAGLRHARKYKLEYIGDSSPWFLWIQYILFSILDLTGSQVETLTTPKPKLEQSFSVFSRFLNAAYALRRGKIPERFWACRTVQESGCWYTS